MNWEDLIGQVTVASVLIGAVAYLARKISEQYFSKDLEKFKAELQMHHNVELEKLRADLRTLAYEREIRIQKLHEKRAEVIAELYSKLSATHRDLISFVTPFEFAGDKSKQEKAAMLQNSAFSFKGYFNENRIYFDEDLCEEIDKFIRSLEKCSRDFSLTLPPSPLAETEKKWELIESAMKTVEEETVKLREEIERRFRKLLTG